MHEEEVVEDGKLKQWFCSCFCCRECCNFITGFYSRYSRDMIPSTSNSIRKEDITYILQHAEGESEGASRHGSFTSGSAVSISSGRSNSMVAGVPESISRDLKDESYSQIEARRASSITARKESTVPVIDINASMRSIDFWTGTSRDQYVQPKHLLSPGRRDTICSTGSQSSADQIRPDLYSEDALGRESDSSVELLGSLHFALNYEIALKILSVKIIEARDLPKPIALDSSKQDNAHSNPYVKVCLLPNRMDSRQSSLRKKTQNPVFDETFTFEISFLELQRRTIQFLIKDFDKYTRHRVIGEVQLPCEDLNVVKGVNLWRPLKEYVQNVTHEDLGEILFSLCFLPAAGRLNVDVLKAKQLPPTSITGGGAPYVRVSLVINEKHVKTKKTSCQKYTYEPVFNESLSFDVNSVQLTDCSIVISLLDGGVTRDSFIGRIVLGKEASGSHEVNHWKNMVSSQRIPIAQWHSLKTKSHCDDTCLASRLL